MVDQDPGVLRAEAERMQTGRFAQDIASLYQNKPEAVPVPEYQRRIGEMLGQEPDAFVQSFHELFSEISNSDLRSLVQAADELPADIPAELQESAGRVQGFVRIARGIFDLYKDRNPSVDEHTLSVRLGFSPADALQAAPLGEGEQNAPSTPLPAPEGGRGGSNDGTVDQLNQQPEQSFEGVIPTEEQAADMSRQANEAIAKGDKEEVGKMLGKVRSALNSPEAKAIGKGLRILLLSIYVATALYIGGVYLMAKYRGGRGGQ